MKKRPEDDPCCHACDAACGPTSDRVFIRYNWYCGSCVYRMEHPHASEQSLAKPKQRRAHRQAERLFEDAA